MNTVKSPFSLLLAILLLTGCAVSPKISSGAVDSPAASVSPSPSEDLTARTPSPVPSAKSSPPPQLDAISQGAEDLFGDIEKKDWTAANNGAKALKAEFSEIKASLDPRTAANNAVGGMETAVNKLLTAIGNEKNYDARLQANAIESYLADLYDDYTVSLPTDLIRLRCLTRQIALGAEKADWTAASGDCGETADRWNTLKAQLSAWAYADDLNTVNANVEKLKAAVDKESAGDTQRYAGILLTNLKLIESDFKKQLSIL
ncbi:hypothetical protein SDC9_67963 [bioreactor metagenome]|uniref:Lipoprotein n=1 Tax=bioreactor metagenome TaxID=1076179 RepID=A0A644XZH5_9ZZZZ